jgi:two-component system phosphate regulon response regulator PhoB
MVSLGSKRCLVVDDDPSIRELVIINLEAEGMLVQSTDNGDEAERMARASPHPDLIVLDVMMPGRDGYELLASLKADDATRQIPVVLLTAKASDAEVWSGWNSGADYYITKPFNVGELVYFLHTIFENGEPDDPTVPEGVTPSGR